MTDDPKKIDQGEIEELMRQARAEDSPKTTGDSQPDTPLLGQNEIEALIPSGTPSPVSMPAESDAAVETAQFDSPPVPSFEDKKEGKGLQGGDIDALFQHATSALASIDTPTNGLPGGIAPFELQDFTGTPASTDKATLELLRDVELDLKIELGRTMMYLEDVLKLQKGAVVPLDKMAGDPVDIFVNGRLIARGEVLVLNDNFCVRVAQLVATNKPG